MTKPLKFRLPKLHPPFSFGQIKENHYYVLLGMYQLLCKNPVMVHKPNSKTETFDMIDSVGRIFHDVSLEFINDPNLNTPMELITDKPSSTDD